MTRARATNDQTPAPAGQGGAARMPGALLARALHPLVRWRNRRRLLVLTYHGVLSRPDGGFLNRNCVGVEEFERQVRFLRRHYRLLTLEEALDGIAGRRPLPSHSALITFDDGFLNNAELAGPVLRAQGAPAVVFVTTGMLDQPGTLPWVERVSAAIMLTRATTLELKTEGAPRRYDFGIPGERRRACEEVRRRLKRAASGERERVMAELERQCPIPEGALTPERFRFMSWEDAGSLAGNGVAIGSHTVRHLCVSTLDDGELADEIGTSKRRIEESLGGPCMAFAYPDGTPESFGPRDREALRAAGYGGAFSQIPGTNRVGDDLFALKRYNVPGGAAGFTGFLTTMTGLRQGVQRLRSLGRSPRSNGVPSAAEVKRQAGEHFTSLAGEYHHRNYEAAVRRGKYPDIHMRHRHILAMLDSSPAARALEIGVGGGEMLAALQARGHQVFGVDLSRDMVAAARAHVAAASGTTLGTLAAADIERLCFPNESFDLVVAAGVIEYLPGPDFALAEIARVLRPGGRVVISIRNRFSLGRPLVAFRDLLEDYSLTAPLASAGTAVIRRLSGGPGRPEVVFARRYLPWRFGRELQRHGLMPIGRAFYHFSVLPGAIERRFPRPSISTEVRLEALARTPLGYLGRGCIFLARKEEKAAGP